MIQVEHYYYFSSLCMRMRENGCLERVCGGPYIAQGGRFPPELNMETLITAIRRIRSSFPPKLSVTGFQVGSADPPVPPLATAFVWVAA